MSVNPERHEVLPSEEIKRRIAEKSALVAELEARMKPAQTAAQPGAQVVPALTSYITADPATLARLVKVASKADLRAARSGEIANQDRIAAQDARAALDAYMRENGLA